MSKLKVLIAGGGLGGLCLAQGLTGAGIDCEVFEKEAGVLQSGYRLHMNGDGGNALRACLPESLYELYRQTSRKNPRRELAVMIDSQAVEKAARPHIGPPNDPIRPHTAVNRRTLRQILLSGMEEKVRFGTAAVRFEQDGQGVRLHLSDGSIAEGDLLVAADGINSAVRRQLMPELEPADTGMRTIYAKSPLTEEIAASLPEVLFDGFIGATDPTGTFAGIGAFVPRRPIAEAAAELAPGSVIDPVDPYMMIALSRGFGPLPLSDSELREASVERLHALMLELTEGWAVPLRGLIERVEVPSIFPQSVRVLKPAAPWDTGRVTLLGDAIHAMPPTFGAGANLALKDAGELAARLIQAEHGELSLLQAVAGYEEAMRGYAYPILEMSVNPAFKTDFSQGPGGQAAG
ncbi:MULTISPECIES: FAD-dependent oxidoreductase [Paenibacillus]|uniref:FAD-dependent oxidoreductase n=1 Tax=Paenibacillus TaxID=44249 RepID=UPI0022B93C5C|nr:FAD-dependent monooxygenase [Paenibacillus caseinilyticus]MCZ8518363.1 FAD-dependent monooxygenase [Paenibacillus caseinilyticus]